VSLAPAPLPPIVVPPEVESSASVPPAEAQLVAPLPPPPSSRTRTVTLEEDLDMVPSASGPHPAVPFEVRADLCCKYIDLYERGASAKDITFAMSAYWPKDFDLSWGQLQSFLRTNSLARKLPRFFRDWYAGKRLTLPGPSGRKLPIAPAQRKAPTSAAPSAPSGPSAIATRQVAPVAAMSVPASSVSDALNLLVLEGVLDRETAWDKFIEYTAR
jgi:hypothetical protein